MLVFYLECCSYYEEDYMMNKFLKVILVYVIVILVFALIYWFSSVEDNRAFIYNEEMIVWKQYDEFLIESRIYHDLDQIHLKKFLEEYYDQRYTAKKGRLTTLDFVKISDSEGALLYFPDIKGNGNVQDVIDFGWIDYYTAFLAERSNYFSVDFVAKLYYDVDENEFSVNGEENEIFSFLYKITTYNLKNDNDYRKAFKFYAMTSEPIDDVRDLVYNYSPKQYLEIDESKASVAGGGGVTTLLFPITDVNEIILDYTCIYPSDIPYIMEEVFRESKSMSVWDFIYFSIVTITTLGYGDIIPNTSFIRMMVAIESISGIILMGIAINYLVLNKSE